jgi:hypothetical protein
VFALAPGGCRSTKSSHVTRRVLEFLRVHGYTPHPCSFFVVDFLFSFLQNKTKQNNNKTTTTKKRLIIRSVFCGNNETNMLSALSHNLTAAGRIEPMDVSSMKEMGHDAWNDLVSQ